ncbi:toxic anion resistance protein [Pseudomonas aeruginosa]
MTKTTEINEAQSMTQPVLVTQGEHLPALNLSTLGLSENDLPEINALALLIKPESPDTVFNFGRQVADHTSGYADALLAQVRNSDLDTAGAKLTEVLTVAQGINVNALLNTRSRIPVIGKIIDRMRLKGRKVMGEFDSTSQQIEKLIQEVSTTQSGMASRNAGLEEMFGSVREEHRLLGVHIAAGKQRLAEIQSQANEMRQKIGNDPAMLQAVSDMDNLVANLDKRIGDLMALQQSAMQTLPAIRVIQANNQMLIDKLYSVQTVTVPTWKRQFLLALSLNEQANSLALVETIDDTTNQLLRANAELLYKNSVSSAKANQRLVIDIETLKSTQDTLIATVTDVIKIQSEGAESRRKAERAIEGMRVDLQKRLGRVQDEQQKVLH